MNNKKALKLLDKIYDSWTHRFNSDDGEELRLPSYQEELESSRELLDKLVQLEFDDEDLVNRYKEYDALVTRYMAEENLESIKDQDTEEDNDLDEEDEKPHYQNNFVRNKGRFITAIIISLGMFFFAYSHMSNKINIEFPEVEYDKGLFKVGKKGGELKWNSYTEKKDKYDPRKIVKKKRSLKAGTQIKPIFNFGKRSFIVELPNGQRGIISSTSLKVGDYLVAKKKARIFSKIGREVGSEERISEGTKAVVIKRVVKGKGIMADRYVQLKLEDGRVKWALEPDFKIDNLPKFPGRVPFYSTTTELAEKHIIGKTQKEIEDYYGTALYVDKTKGKHTIYFQSLTVVKDNGDHYTGIFIDFGKNGLGKEIIYLGSGESRWMDMFPYVERVRELELNKYMHWSFLLNFPIIADWQKSMKDWYNGLRKYNWIMGFVVFGFDLILYVLGIILFYTLARIFVNPILQFFTYIRFINQIALLFNTIIIFVATYAAFVVLVFLEDGFFWAGSLGFLVLFRGVLKNKATIEYNLCPECGTMYAGFNSGSTFTGKTTSVLKEKYREYKGTSADGKYRYYEDKIKETTTDTDHYLDHQGCDQCGHSWDVDREDSNTY